MALINENTATFEGRTNQLNSHDVSLDGRNFNTITLPEIGRVWLNIYTHLRELNNNQELISESL